MFTGAALILSTLTFFSFFFFPFCFLKFSFSWNGTGHTNQAFLLVWKIQVQLHLIICCREFGRHTMKRWSSCMKKLKNTLSQMRMWLMGDDPYNSEGELLFWWAGFGLLLALHSSSVYCLLTSIWWAKKHSGYLKKQARVLNDFFGYSRYDTNHSSNYSLRLNRVAEKKL